MTSKVERIIFQGHSKAALPAALRSVVNGGLVEMARGHVVDRALTWLKRAQSPIRASFRVVNIEPTNFCNQKCCFCPTGLGTNLRPKGMLSFHLFKKIVDDLPPATPLVLAGFGEPFLNEELERFLEYCGETRLSQNLEIYSNFGAVSEDRIRRLPRLPFRRLIISLDSLNRDTFREQKGCDQFPRVFENVRILSDAMKGRARFSHDVIVQMIVTKKNRDESGRFVETVKAMGLIPRLKQLNTHMPRLSEERIGELEVREFTRYERKTYTRRCEWVWGGLQIFWNGDATICCQDPTGTMIYGNVDRTSPRDLLNRAERRCDFRRRYFEDPGQLDICRHCDRA
jgi:MoaA/NifB/PqqE/SkfB family radical SAM enzyme